MLQVQVISLSLPFKAKYRYSLSVLTGRASPLSKGQFPFENTGLEL